MFTGIIEEVGHINKITRNNMKCKLSIQALTIMEDIHLGDSIAVNGICLTVTQYSKQLFTVDVMNETWKKTSLRYLKEHSPINLERALRVDGRFGGHIVTGHIDGIGKIQKIQKDGNAFLYQIESIPKILTCIVEKGSITIDGISLTVVSITKTYFIVSIIPHTLTQTILTFKKVGDIVNLETDILGKYVQKIIKTSTLTESFLYQNGF